MPSNFDKDLLPVDRRDVHDPQAMSEYAEDVFKPRAKLAAVVNSLQKHKRLHPLDPGTEA